MAQLNSKDEFHDDNMYILHVSDWNYEDRYYEAPLTLLRELKGRILREGMSEAWDWWTDQVDYGNSSNAGKPVKTGRVDMDLDTIFLDYTEPRDSVGEWEF